MPLLKGVKDFLDQLGPGAGKAQQAMNAELPYELLRRSGWVRACVGGWGGVFGCAALWWVVSRWGGGLTTDCEKKGGRNGFLTD